MQRNNLWTAGGSNDASPGCWRSVDLRDVHRAGNVAKPQHRHHHGDAAGRPLEKSASQRDNSAGVGVTLSPGTATLAANHRIMLTAQVFGSANSAVAWTVNGFTNGTGTVGQICVVASIPCQPLTAGNNLQVDYQAPGAIATPNPVTVRATSLADSTRSATAQITVIN